MTRDDILLRLTIGMAASRDGRDGRIAFKGPRGPAGFRPPLLEAAIKKELEQTKL